MQSGKDCLTRLASNLISASWLDQIMRITTRAFNVAKSVARFSFGLSKKDDTGKVIDRFVERIEANSSSGFFDDASKNKGGVYDVYGLLSFIFIRQALQLHANVHLKDRKLPKLRTFAEKYLKMLPDMVRQDGLGWNYGRSVGAYGQIHCISMILQSMLIIGLILKKCLYISIHFVGYFSTFLLHTLTKKKEI